LPRIDADKVDMMIRQAVEKAFEAGRMFRSQSQADAYKATERRLYALPIIRRKLLEDRERLAEIMISEELEPGPERSKDIVRFRNSAVTLSEDDIIQALRIDLEAMIASKEHEIKEMEGALDQILDDQYYQAVPMKYFDKKCDDEIATAIHCDPSTVRRNRSKLIKKMAIWLYGPEAI
jgi:hypothetical protein